MGFSSLMVCSLSCVVIKLRFILKTGRLSSPDTSRQRGQGWEALGVALPTEAPAELGQSCVWVCASPRSPWGRDPCGPIIGVGPTASWTLLWAGWRRIPDSGRPTSGLAGYTHGAGGGGCFKCVGLMPGRIGPVD